MKATQKIAWHIKRTFFSIVFYVRFWLYPYTTIKNIKVPVSYKWSFSLLKALYDKTYEQGELNIIDKVLEKDDKVLEIGTGLGLISAFCAKKIDNKNIVTYEANPLIKNHILHLYSINKVSPSLNIALVSNNSDSHIFYSEPNDIWSSSMIKLSSIALHQTMNSENISDVIEKHKPNFLIVDVEGAEIYLIPKIDFTKINKLQIELHKKLIGEEKVNKVIDIIKSMGFKVHERLSTMEQYYFYKNER